MKRVLSLLLCLILCLFLFQPMLAKADFGDFSGDSDYDFGDSDYGSDYDYDYNDYNDYNDYDYDDDDYDYGGSSYTGSSHSSSLGTGSLISTMVLFGVRVALILFIIRLIVKKLTRRSTTRRKYTAPAPRQPAAPALRSMAEYAKLDPTFDQAAFTSRLSNLYVQMQNGWQRKDIESLRPYFTDTLYAQMDRQLDTLRKQKRTNYVQRIAVLGVTPLGFRQEGSMDTIVVELRTRIVDYTLDDVTEELVSGDKNKEKFMTYRWELTRPSGTQTVRQGGVTSITCPHCGAALNINQSAQCPYCDSIITLETHDWVISAIRGISQKTK